MDFSYLCPQRGLLGETWLAHIELEGPLDEQGMVCDFGVVKSQLRQWMDDTLDHKLLVPAQHPSYSIQDEQGFTRVSESTRREVLSPNTAIACLPLESITPTRVARWCEQQLLGLFGAVDAVHIQFTTEPIDGPYYHYSHGLKKHRGNCQRIAHGHRSKLLIWKDQALSLPHMTEWADQWCDIYLGSNSDCISRTDELSTFEYRAPQGAFYLRLPTAQCYLMDTDTTVEHIAQHIANTLAAREPGHHFRVKAFEGISKGAIAEAQHQTD